MLPQGPCLQPAPELGSLQGLCHEGSASPRGAAPLSASCPRTERGWVLETGGQREAESPWRKEAQQKASLLAGESLNRGVQSFHQAKFGARVPPSVLCRAQPGRVARRWSSSRGGAGSELSSDRLRAQISLGRSPLLLPPCTAPSEGQESMRAASHSPCGGTAPGPAHGTDHNLCLLPPCRDIRAPRWGTELTLAALLQGAGRPQRGAQHQQGAGCPALHTQSSPALPGAGFHTAVKPHKARGWLAPEHGDIATQEAERLQRGSACNASHGHSPAYQGVLTQTTNRGKKTREAAAGSLQSPAALIPWALAALGAAPAAAPSPHLVQESLAELLHGSLELVSLGLPLLVVPDVLGRGALPRGGPGVVVHVVVPAPRVHALLPPGSTTGRCHRLSSPGTGARWDLPALL